MTLALAPEGSAAEEFGFEIPQGDPAELSAAAKQAGLVADAWHSNVGTVKRAASAASAGWKGAAQSAFGSYAAVLVVAYDHNSDVLSKAGSVLAGLASDLETAQAATRRAYEQCAHYQGVVETQTQVQQQYAQKASQLSTQASQAAHPHARVTLTNQANAQQQLADQAASKLKDAHDELDMSAKAPVPVRHRGRCQLHQEQAAGDLQDPAR